MRLVNFDEQFQRHTVAWMQDHAGEYGNNLDRMEEKMPEVYLQWLNTPADWLAGQTPGAYFAQYDDVPQLMDWMRAYFAKGMPVPDQLLERIVGLGGAAEAALLAMLGDEDAPHDARLTAITLLGEMESTRPLALYIGWIAGMQAGDEMADMAAEALSSMGRQVVAPVLAAIDAATPAGQEAFLDVLCNFPGEEAIYARAMRAFLAARDRRALHASLLGKLGDERAIPALREAMEEADISYLDYIELRNALEAVGGEAPPERIFDGDPYFESLRRMQ